MEVVKQSIKKLLSLPERIHLLSLLPGEGEYSSLRITRQLREELSLTEEEHKIFGFSSEIKNGQTQCTWTNAEAAMKPKEFQFQPKALSIVRDALIRLNEAKKLRTEHLSLYEAFVEE